MLGDGPQYVLDYDEFVKSLELHQAAFLHVALQGSVNKRYFPLRAALDKRLAESPIKSGLSQLLIRCGFYKPNKAR